MSSTDIPTIVPAHLSFLAIYNPSLGCSDETFHQQIVFYYSKAAKARSRLGHDVEQTVQAEQAEQALRQRENEKLRQVGLAQGMVDFARSFSNGAAIDSVETQKSRIVLHELEKGWWILASIALTQLPATKHASKKDSYNTQPAVEYSSREVSPPLLLIQQLVRAHSIFLLHHGSSFADMFAKHDRPKFCSVLDRYWSRFVSSWDVLLHGSPAVDVYNGMKLAGGGELGVGVGEEAWGSGERDVLESFVNRTDGLKDVLVSRFGKSSPLQEAKTSTDLRNLDVIESEPWLGSGRHVHAADGVIFSGLGAIGRKSLRDVSHWVESIYCHGEHAYGVRDNPTADRRKRRRKTPKSEQEQSDSKAVTVAQDERLGSTVPRIPPPIVRTSDGVPGKKTTALDVAKDQEEPREISGSKPVLASLGDSETWMKYMMLGYGTAWGNKKSGESQPSILAPPASRTPSPETKRSVEPMPDMDVAEENRKLQIQQENNGYFLVGLKGSMEDLSFDDANESGDWNNRIPLRTIHVEMISEDDATSPSNPHCGETPQFESAMANFQTPPARNLSRVRPVIYVHRPFIYVFLFDSRAGALTISSFYRDIHNFFSPLRHSLDKSTSSEKVTARLAAAAAAATNTSLSTATSRKGSDPYTRPIYDLVFDPISLTVQSSLPSIPDPGDLMAGGLSSNSSSGQCWNRAEALSVHSQILSTVSNTRRNLAEIEHTCKTSRSWWIIWMRLPPSRFDRETLQPRPGSQSGLSTASAPKWTPATQSSALFNTDELREAFLVRRARDAAAPSMASANRFSSVMWSTMGLGAGSQSQKTGGAADRWDPKGLAEGIGVDARRYIEDLLSLNR